VTESDRWHRQALWWIAAAAILPRVPAPSIDACGRRFRSNRPRLLPPRRPWRRGRITGEKLGDAETAGAARDDVMIAVRRGHIAQDFGNGADAMQVLGPRRVDRGIFCRTTPIGLSARAAAWAPAMDRGRPRPSGATTPGKRTALRVGRMIRRDRAV
jgi:hypothetical protein